MNRLSLDRRTQAIGCLIEGNSIRSTERMTGIHRDTIMRLLVEVGTGCGRLMDEQMRELPCERLQVDEIWTYVAKKQRQVTKEDDKSRVGDQWTFVALDADTKLVPSYRIGKRNLPTAKAFMVDLSERGWRTAFSYRQTHSPPTLKRPRQRSGQMLTTGRW